MVNERNFKLHFLIMEKEHSTEIMNSTWNRGLISWISSAKNIRELFRVNLTKKPHLKFIKKKNKNKYNQGFVYQPPNIERTKRGKIY